MGGTQGVFGQQLRRFREAQGLKQAALAEMIRVDQATISRWERGSHVPDPTAQTRLASILSKALTADAALRHATSVAIGAVMLSDAEQRIVAASLQFCRDHGVNPNAIRGMNARAIDDEEARELWRKACDAGFYERSVASVTVITRIHTLSKHRSDVPTKSVWVPVRATDNSTWRRVEQIELREDEYSAAREANGGAIKIVTIDQVTS